MEKYKDYNTGDFEHNDYFIKWVRNPDEKTNVFWVNFLKEYPEKKDVIIEARNSVLAYYKMVKPKEMKHRQERSDQTWQNIREGKKSPGKVLGGRHNPLLKIAIGFLGVVAMALGVFKSGIFDKNSPEVNTPQITLELQDGSIQVVDENTSKIITTAKGQKVVNQENNVLVYDEGAETTTEDLAYNHLTVPYGKRFELVLSDGSHVFLNAGSSLRYPVKFSPESRDVYLNGEAFFEIEKDQARPFTVVTQEMNTRVYGTKFNVTSYKNENNTYTVLVEGSVGVYQPDKDEGEHPFTIVPGQRALFENGSIGVEEVKVEKYTAWTKGELYFMDDPFELIIKKLERHFNVEIECNFPELNQKEFTATFKKDETLEQILDAYRRHTPFSYQKKGNKITITPPE